MTRWVGMAAVLALAACGSKDGDTGDTGATGTGTATGGTTATATGTGTGGTATGGATGLSHAADIQPIWDAKCAPCHTVTQSGNLDLNDGYTALVDVPSTQVGDLDLIEPGEPENSYAWRKLEDTHDDVGGFGTIMPQTGSLSDGELTMIETWITEGALP